MANKSQQSSSPIHSRSLLQSDKLTWDFDVLGLVCFYFVLGLLDHLLERDQGIFMTRVVVLQRPDVNSWKRKKKEQFRVDFTTGGKYLTWNLVGTSLTIVN